jgi:hypothetical protein
LEAAGTFVFSAAFPWMPRYFFNVFYGPSNVDVIGEDLPDKQAAWHGGTLVAGFFTIWTADFSRGKSGGLRSRTTPRIYFT